MATTSDTRSSSGDGPVRASAPWARADSIGYPAWQRLRHPSISISETALAVGGHQATAVYERHMAFVDSLAVKPGGSDGAGSHGHRDDDLRVFRSATSAAAPERYDAAWRAAPPALARAVVGSGATVYRSALNNIEAHGDTPSSAAVMRRTGTNAPSAKDAAAGSPVAASVGNADVSAVAVNTGSTVVNTAAVHTATTAQRPVAAPPPLARSIDGTRDVTGEPSRVGASPAPGSSVGQAAALSSAMGSNLASAGQPATLVHRSASACPTLDARLSSSASIADVPAAIGTAARESFPALPSREPSSATGVPCSAPVASSSTSSRSESAPAPALGELARAIAPRAAALPIPTLGEPAEAHAPSLVDAHGAARRATSAPTARAIEGEAPAHPSTLPGVAADVVPRVDVSMPLVPRGHALRSMRDHAERAAERGNGTIEASRSAEPPAAVASMGGVLTSGVAVPGSREAITAAGTALDPRAGVGVGGSVVGSAGISVSPSPVTGLNASPSPTSSPSPRASAGTGSETNPLTMREGAPSSEANPTLAIPVVMSAQANSLSMRAEGPATGPAVTLPSMDAPAMVLRRRVSAGSGDRPKHGALSAGPPVADAAGLAAEPSHGVDSTGAALPASAGAPRASATAATSATAPVLATTSIAPIQRHAAPSAALLPRAGSAEAAASSRPRTGVLPWGTAPGAATGAMTSDARHASLARSHTAIGPQPPFGAPGALAIGASPMARVPEPARPSGLIFAASPRGSMIGRRTMVAQAVDRAYRLPDIAAAGRGARAVDSLRAASAVDRTQAQTQAQGRSQALVDPHAPVANRLHLAESASGAATAAGSREGETSGAARLDRQFDEAPARAYPLIERQPTVMPLAHPRAPWAASSAASMEPATVSRSAGSPAPTTVDSHASGNSGRDDPTAVGADGDFAAGRSGAGTAFALASVASAAAPSPEAAAAQAHTTQATTATFTFPAASAQPKPAMATAMTTATAQAQAHASPPASSFGMSLMRVATPLRQRPTIPRPSGAASIDPSIGASIAAPAGQPMVGLAAGAGTRPAAAFVHRSPASPLPAGESDRDRFGAQLQPQSRYATGDADAHRAIDRNAAEWPLVSSMRASAAPDALVPAAGWSSASGAMSASASSPTRATRSGAVDMPVVRRMPAPAPPIDRAFMATDAPAAHVTSPLADLLMPALAAPTVHHAEGAHVGATRGEVDVDEIVERVWREVLSRLAIDQERRGFARWA